MSPEDVARIFNIPEYTLKDLEPSAREMAEERERQFMADLARWQAELLSKMSTAGPVDERS